VSRARTFICALAALAACLGLVWACGHDDSLREYLSARFWLPFAKRPPAFERPNITRVDEPFAGMTRTNGQGTLGALRAAYQTIAHPQSEAVDNVRSGGKLITEHLAAARADAALTPGEREEVDLIDAKIDLRNGDATRPEPLHSARRKLEAFLKTARTPAFRSEARGWLGRVHYLLGNRVAAGKIYLDELNATGSNLSRKTLLDSLYLVHGYDGGQDLLDHLEEYFDTAEHAAFAIQLVTNPQWNRYDRRFEPPDGREQSYPRVKGLLEKHASLLKSNDGANALALLSMRAALRMGDPAGALSVAKAVPSNAEIRTEPDFLWMLASSRFLTRDFAGAEQPLLALFRSRRATENQRAAAAYGLCGVYRKTGDFAGQIRYALWLHTIVKRQQLYWSEPASITGMSIYWAYSGWDLGLLLDMEAPMEALVAFIEQNPRLDGIRLVKYALAVRLSRENRYAEAADIYASINQVRRAPRLKKLAALYEQANRQDLPEPERLQALFDFAQFLSAHSDGIYFNDSLWGGFQGYALSGTSEYRLTAPERRSLLAAERKLKDDQEELWRAYLILRDVAERSGRNELGRKAAALAIRCVRRISYRFGRSDEIAQADIDLTNWLRR
jgi:hypothetical protein